MTQSNTSLALIRGVMVRSGTNFLLDLLQRHPDCAAARRDLPEDFFLDESALLRRFVERIADRWPDTWNIDRGMMTADMMAALGNGLEGFLRDGASERLVISKTPSSVGLDEVTALFPGSKVILLVRDGRGAIDSAMRSFDWSFERGLHTWTTGAARILAHVEQRRDDPDVLLVRYEDVLTEPDVELPRILTFLDLDPEGIAPSTVADLPVRGSSDSATDGAPSWKPQPRTANFDPLARGHEWNPARVERFARTAGDSMRALGYEIEPIVTSGVRHLVEDAFAMWERQARAAKGRVRHRLGTGSWRR